MIDIIVQDQIDDTVLDVADLTRYVTKYQRQANGQQGDISATLTVETKVSRLRTLFAQILGYWLLEHDLTERTFTGQVNVLRLYIEGRIYLYTLANTYNDIVVQYETTAGGGALTINVSDSTSQTRWGKRSLLYELDTPLPTADATNLANELLATLKDPAAPEMMGLYDAAAGNRMEVQVVGCGTLAGLALMTPVTAAYQNVDVAVAAVATAVDVWSAGDIASNTRQVETVTAYMTAQERLDNLLAVAGPQWRAGCYGSPALDFFELDITDPTYSIEFRRGEARFLDTTQGKVSEAQVKPGRYAYLSEEPGLPNVLLIDSVTYDLHAGLTFGVLLQDRLAALAFELERELDAQ